MNCNVCDKEQPVSEFYVDKRNGHPWKECKSCTKKRMAEYRKRPGVRQRIREYFQSLASKPERQAKKLDYQRKSRSQNPDKAKAYYTVWNAIRSGKLKQEPCAICGGPAEAHHEDYSKPLDVVWLCFKHHREVHGQEVMAA